MSIIPPSSKRSQMQEYFMIKRSADLPPKINIIFSIMERVIEIPDGWKNVSSNAKQHNKPFLEAFSKLSIQEQSKYMNELIKYVVKLLHKKEDQIIEESSIQCIETSVQIQSSYLKIPVWLEFSFRLDRAKKTIYLNSKKKSETIDLHHYLVRKSKKNKDYVVLEGFAPQVNKNESKKYTMSFLNELADQVYQQLFSIMLSIQKQEFEKLIEGSENSVMKTKSYSGENSNMVFLSSKNINEFLNYKDSIAKYMLSNKVQFRLISSPNQKNFRIQQGNKMEKVFKLESYLKVQPRLAKEVFLSNLKNRKSSITVASQILQNFSGKYFAIYEKYLISNKIQELITIREESLADNEDLLFIKGIDNLMVKNFLQFLIVRIKQEPKGEQSKLTIICSIFLNDYITPDVVKFYLKTLYENSFVEKTKISKAKSFEVQSNFPGKQQHFQDFDANEFQTVFGNAFNEQYVEFVECDEELKAQTKHNLNIFQKIKESNEQIQVRYLKHVYQFVPTKEFDLLNNRIKDHYLWKDWVRRKQGGVICMNEDLVNAQKKLFKDTVTSLGSQILKSGTNVLNLSLPVTVFKKQSHLHSISRNFCFAPLLFEKKFTDNVQRMKYCTILTVSVGNLSIHMEKPFNPMLGETLQTWIGGCPMYLEQISHHPPISSYYFIGRGYKLYGMIEPKISFGFNNVKGYSERPNTVIFDDGTEVEMIFGKMIIYGMMFGQREFNFEDKVFAYDKTHHIFSEIIYGPRRKGVFSKSFEPWDFCFGKIYKLKEEFLEKFQASYPRIFPHKDYILKQLSSFEGVWGQNMEFDGVPYYNFKTQLPCSVVDEQMPIPSNSHYRQDLYYLLKGDIPESQKYKEIMQEIQRRDKKLRQKNKAERKAEQALKEQEAKRELQSRKSLVK